MTNTIKEDDLRDEITSIIYGGDWKASGIADAFKPDVEAIMKLVRRYGLEQRISELQKLDLNNNPRPCREDCSNIEHAEHEGYYGHYLHIESYKNGRIAELTTLKEQEKE